MFVISKEEQQAILDAYRKPRECEKKERSEEQLYRDIEAWEQEGTKKRVDAAANIDMMLIEMMSGRFDVKQIEWLMNLSKQQIDEIDQLKKKCGALSRELMKAHLRPSNSASYPSLKR